MPRKYVSELSTAELSWVGEISLSGLTWPFAAIDHASKRQGINIFGNIAAVLGSIHYAAANARKQQHAAPYATEQTTGKTNILSALPKKKPQISLRIY